MSFETRLKLVSSLSCSLPGSPHVMTIRTYVVLLAIRYILRLASAGTPWSLRPSTILKMPHNQFRLQQFFQYALSEVSSPQAKKRPYVYFSFTVPNAVALRCLCLYALCAPHTVPYCACNSLAVGDVVCTCWSGGTRWAGLP